MNKVVQKLEEIKNLVDHNFDNLQAYFDIERDWPVDETRLIDGSYHTKIFQDASSMRFISHFPPSTKMDNHWHDCAEMCTVLCGELHDFRSGLTWSKDQVAIFSMGERHIPGNPSEENDLHLLVDFFKPKVVDHH